jgi:5'-deoxynucleotidase YfbR-like HD superfamily hydrolase
MNREEMKHSMFLSGCVIRYHGFPTLQTQTVAAHSWRVATLVIEIFGMPRAEVLHYALHHDCGEMFSGDLPYLVKKAIPGLAAAMKAAEAHGLDLLDIHMPELTPLEKVQVKIADLVEMSEFGAMEVRLGNQFGVMVRDDTIVQARQLAIENNLDKELDTWESKHGQ